MNLNPQWHFRALLFWLVLMAGLYFAFDRYLAPTVVAVSAPNDGEIVIPRSRDGHYYLAGSINGQPVTFLVDTGATVVSVSRALATAAGLPGGYPTTFNSANGSRKGELVANQSVEAGGVVVGPIDVAVGLDLGRADLALLGQNFLKRMDMIQRDDLLTLRIRTR
ncbi:MAG: TIGR02281 family clan AA aspartic protease [Rhodocyclaceae bacterium]|jgi:aspartyl protease family protein|nr:TIGR02281 family clan AA aspartic protease [Rhodocyclaceae bacterium]